MAVKIKNPITKADINRFKSRIPVLLANQAQNHFLEGFRKGGKQTDASRSGWKQRKAARSRKNQGRAILVQSGDLRADIKRRETSFARTVVGTRNIIYAARHNDGLAAMPKREFIGDSRALDRKNRKLIEKNLPKK